MAPSGVIVFEALLKVRQAHLERGESLPGAVVQVTSYSSSLHPAFSANAAKGSVRLPFVAPPEIQVRREKSSMLLLLFVFRPRLGSGRRDTPVRPRGSSP